MQDRRRLVLIAGPCVIESEKLCARVAGFLKKATARLPITFVFKASFDKANRSSAASYRGPGIDEGLAVLKKIRAEFEVPVLTDVHTEEQVRAAITIDLNTLFAELDAYQKRMHMANILRAARDMQAQ